MGKARLIPIIVTIIVVISFLVVVTRPSGNEGQFPPPIFPVPEGTPVRIVAEALYVDDCGRIITMADLTPVQVGGVGITLLDENGDSQSLTTTEVSSTWCELLSCHRYNIQATFKGSTCSTQATIQGYSDHDMPPSGGYVKVYVRKSSDAIEGVSYNEPGFL
jgi:hypothetical protein